MQETTIAAIATAPGAGGIAVVRLLHPETDLFYQKQKL